MAANHPPPELASGSPCCLAWQRKYLGMKKRRDACKEAIEILQKAMAIASDEKTNLQKKLREMVDNTDSKENVSVAKASLEKEISDLKSEILSLQQKLERNLQEKTEEIKILQDRTCSGEKEIDELKKLLEKETSRADNCEEERERICIELKKTKALLLKYKDIKPLDAKVEKEISLVKNLLVSQRQETETERKKADQYLSELVVLRTTGHKTSSDMLTLTSNLEAVKKQLESEKQKTLRERKRADMESAKAREQMKLAEGLSKKFEIIRARNEELKREAVLQSASRQVKLAENSAKLEEKIRLLEMDKKTAMDWKSRSDDLAQQLQESHSVTEGLKKQVQELSLSQKSSQTRSVSPQKARDLEKAKVRLLKKEIEFERKCAKHSKRVAEFEKIIREFQAEEIVGLKLKFGSLTNRLSLLGDYFSRDVEKGTTGLAKAEGRMRMQMLESQNNRNGKNHSDAKCQLVASSGSQEEARKLSTQLIAKSEQGASGSVSGTISQLKSPTGGSRKLQTSRVISSKKSFSDRQLLASQGTEQFTVTNSAEIAKDQPDIQPTKSSMFQKIDTRTKGNLCLMAKNYLQRRQRDSHEVANEHFRKRKRMPEAVESRKHVCLSTAKVHGPIASFVEDVVAIDYMMLLELDNPEEESRYKMARKSLLSPDLPQVNFLGDDVVNEENKHAMVTSNSVDLCVNINSSEAPSLNTQNASVTVERPRESTTLHGHILKHFVVFSNIEDRNSIIRIFHAANNCIQRCPSATRAQWAVPSILFSSKMEENLSGRERVCVFLSLLLHNFSAVFSMKIGNILDDDSYSCLDSFSKHIAGVMADTEAGGILSEFLEELLSLLQDLLSEQRVWYSAKSSETAEFGLSIPVTLNGENVDLVSRIALIDHLVAGSAILAAICTAVNRVGFIREASFEILRKQSHEKTSVTLTILHVFAHIAGEKMMSSSDHDVSNAMLKSIVMFLEEKHFGTVEGTAMFHPGKNKCPFSDRSSSLEAMALMLMEIVQEFNQSNTLHQSLSEKTEFRPEHKNFQFVLARDQSVTLCDILLLVELIGCYTEWNWTSEYIVAPLLKMLEMPLSINFAVAVVSLLGQLSSIGVDNGGCENGGISNIREKLSAFLQCEATLKAGFAVQVATVWALLKTLELDTSTVFQGKTTMRPGCGGQSLSASSNLITKWFSLLSDEQRVFTTEFIQNLCF